MIITDNFVILNFPKTGSTFVREVVSSLYQNKHKSNPILKALVKLGIMSPGYRELLMPHPTIPNYKDQHGSFSQIPIKHQHKQILSVVRNPYNRFDSQYRFKWWAKHPPLDEGTIKRNFPAFPEIGIDEFISMKKMVSNQLKLRYQIPDEVSIGDQTIQFIEMFFKQPDKVFRKLSKDYINEGQYKEDLCKLKLIQQENLNEQLIQFLSNNGFDINDLQFIRRHEKVNVTTTERDRNAGISKEVVSYVQSSEWILFKILSDLQIQYDVPN